MAECKSIQMGTILFICLFAVFILLLARCRCSLAAHRPSSQHRAVEVRYVIHATVHVVPR